MNNEDIVESWATELGESEFYHLGNGDIGEAFEVGEDKVIKITSSEEEFICAYYQLNSKSEYLVKIHDLRAYDDGRFAILMDKVETGEKIEMIYEELSSFIEYHRLDLFTVLDSEYANDLSKQAVKMAEDINQALCDLIDTGYTSNISFDVKGDNMGINAKGNYCLFDQMDKSKHFNFSRNEELREICEDIKSHYQIDRNKAKSIEIDIHKIAIHYEEARTKLNLIKNGNYESMNGDIECMFNHYGYIQALDTHRFTQSLLLNHENIKIKIVHDERSGIFHETVKAVEPDDELVIDYNLLFTGLEEIEDDEELDEIASKLHKYLEFSSKIRERKAMLIEPSF